MTVFLDFLGFSIVLPYLFFFAQSLGANAFTYGLLVTAYAFTQFVFSPVLGRLSDAYGRRRILLVAILGASISYFVFGIATSIWLLFVARIVAGAMGATFPVAQAYVADITSGEDRLKYLGMLSAAWGLGYVMGPGIGGTLASTFGYAVPSFLAAVLALVNLALAYFKVPESPFKKPKKDAEDKTARSALRSIFANRPLGVLLLLYFTAVLAFNFLNVTLTPWLQEVFNYGPFEAGLIFLYVGTILAVTQAVILPGLSKRASPWTLALVGLAVASAGYVGLGVSSSVGVALLNGGVFSFGYAFVSPSINDMISLSSSEDVQGSTLGIAQSLASLAAVLAPTLAAGSFLLGRSIGFYGLAFLLAAAINTLTIPLLLTVRASRSSGILKYSKQNTDGPRNA